MEHMSAPTPYSASPPIRHCLRPQRSVSLLAGIMRIAMISRNSVMLVCTPFTVVSRSLLMSLIITFKLEPAKLQMNCASASGRISRRADRERAATGLGAAVDRLSATAGLRGGQGDGRCGAHPGNLVREPGTRFVQDGLYGSGSLGRAVGLIPHGRCTAAAGRVQ